MITINVDNSATACLPARARACNGARARPAHYPGSTRVRTGKQPNTPRSCPSASVAITSMSWTPPSFPRVWPIARMSGRCHAWSPWKWDRPADRQCGAPPLHAGANARDHRVWKAFSCKVNDRRNGKVPAKSHTRGAPSSIILNRPELFFVLPPVEQDAGNPQRC